MRASPPKPSRSEMRSPAPLRANAAAKCRSSAASIAADATRPSLPSAPATPTRMASHSFERRVFEHHHLLPDVREVDREETVAAGADDVDDDAFAPLGMADPVARSEIEADAGPGV